MDDLDRYARRRAGHDPAFADGLQQESAAFRVGVCLQQARIDAGLTRAEVADRLDAKPVTVGRMETNAGEIRLSLLQRYAEAVGQRLVLEVRPAKASAPKVDPDTGLVETVARASTPRGVEAAVPPRAPRSPRAARSPLAVRQMRSMAPAEWP